MADTKHLQKREGVWFIRVARPPASWGLKGREFLHSLKTGELKLARKLRDQYLMPLLAEDSALRMVIFIQDTIVRGNDHLKAEVKNLGVNLGGERRDFTIRMLADRFIENAERGDYRPATLKLFRSTLNAFCTVVGAATPVTNIDKAFMITFRNRLAEMPASWMKLQDADAPGAPVEAKDDQERVAPTTIENYLRRLRTVFTWAINEDLMSAPNPGLGVKAPFTRRDAKQTLTVEDADKLIAMPYRQNSLVDGTAWEFMPMIARYTGARLAEIGQLRREDFVEREGLLCIHISAGDGRQLKTESSDRWVPVSDRLRPAVDRLLAGSKGGRLFPHCGDWRDDSGYVQTAHGFSKTWNRHAKKVAAYAYFHAWRHYAINQMADAGIPEIDRMRVVGHAVKGTHAVYTAANLSRYKEAVDRIL